MSQAEYETTAARIEAETSTAKLASEVHHQAEIAHKAAVDAASNAQHVAAPPGTVPAGATTTAANLESQAPTNSAATNIHSTAHEIQNAAGDAASTASTKGAGTTDNTKDSAYALGKDAKATTDAAVAEGQRDVEAAKEAGAGYVSQAKDLAASALAAAQAYLPPSVGGTNTSNTTASGTSQPVTDQARDFAGSALATARSYLPNSAGGTNPSPATSTQTSGTTDLKSSAGNAVAAAQSALAQAQALAQPHVELAQAKAQPVVDSILEKAQTYVGGSTSSPSAVPSHTAPLESGPHSTSTPYPAETGGAVNASKIAENEKRA